LVAERDIWAEWLLHRRYGGDAEELQRMLGFLYPVRDKVLANARIQEGETLLDVGAGDGLIAFGAIEQIGERGEIILSDISQELLDHDRTIVEQMGIAGRCQFVRAAAEDLWPIADASVDVVTTRSVLIYVDAKQRAFDEFFRVLRPGGRISLFEPINRFGQGKSRYDRAPIQDLDDKIRAVYEQLQPPDTDSMLNFDERDLLAFVEQAGFREIYLELRAEVKPTAPRAWETALRTAGNPRSPTLEEAMRQALTPEEARRYEEYRRPLVERGQGMEHWAVAYLWAVK
jgi:ubiquinone/menaquinone biosynthesis C-methylase UbiE